MLLAMGQGFGHGVGMSQWGAHGLAQRGADFRQILNHYYRAQRLFPIGSYRIPLWPSCGALASLEELREWETPN